jgi:vacuolar-type H+-ATPase subunit E/Vma4
MAEKSAHADAAGQARASQLINAARLDNKRSLASARERGIAEVYDAAARELAKMRSDGSYPALFRALLREALTGVEGDVAVLVDPADKALAESALAELGVNGSVDTSTPMVGGVTVATRGMRVFRRNALEDRLARARKIGQSQVAEILFG